jgi:hypothetical protein
MQERGDQPPLQRERRQVIRSRVLKACLPLLAILGVAAGAWAFWTTQGTGSASATVGQLNAPTQVTVPSTASGTVHVSWTGSTLGDGATPASGYYVTRLKNSDSSISNACGTSPSSPTSSTAASCDDTSVPDGTYHYTVTAVYRSWTATSTASGDVVTTAATLDHFTLAAPATATAGTAFNVTVTARDASNNALTGYTGTVHFTSSDAGSPGLPSNYTFVAGDNGSHTFTNGVTLKTAGSQTVSVNDTVETSKTGTATISVSPAGADHFKVTAPASATAGSAFNTVTLTAQDPYNNTATGYANGNHTIAWSGASTSPGGNAPNYPTSTVSFTNGVSTTTLSATLFAAGSNSLTATATSPSLTGTATISVSPAGADHFKVTAPASATAGSAFNTVTLTAQDPYNNTATGYANGNHTIAWSGASTSPGGNAPNYPTSTVSFTNGVSTTTLSATLFAAGSNNLTATATSPSLTGTATISVSSAGVVLSYNRTCPVSVAKNSSTVFTILVPNDTYGNSFTNPSGIAIGLTLSNTANFGFGAVGTGTTTVTITTGPANNTFTVVESGANKTTSLTATAPSGFTAPGPCTINAGS